MPEKIIHLNPIDNAAKLEHVFRTTGAWSYTRKSMQYAHYFLARNPSLDKAMSRCGAIQVHIGDLSPVEDPPTKCLACSLFEQSSEEVKRINERMVERTQATIEDK